MTPRSVHSGGNPLGRDIEDQRYLDALFAILDRSWSSYKARYVLGWTSCIGYLQRALPERFDVDVRWGDIFDLSEIYAYDAVEAET